MQLRNGFVGVFQGQFSWTSPGQFFFTVFSGQFLRDVFPGSLLATFLADLKKYSSVQYFKIFGSRHIS